MTKKCLNDFQIGYDYVRERIELWRGKSLKFIIAIGKAFFLQTGENAELSKGMGAYYLELGLEITTEELKRQLRV